MRLWHNFNHETADDELVNTAFDICEQANEMQVKLLGLTMELAMGGSGRPRLNFDNEGGAHRNGLEGHEQELTAEEAST